MSEQITVSNEIPSVDELAEIAKTELQKLAKPGLFRPEPQPEQQQEGGE